MAPVSTATPAAWTRLASHITDWFYRPDLEALEVAVSAAVAHYGVESDPVWLFVLGPSGSGKSSVIINALSGLPKTWVMGDLTTKTFISHFKGKENAGLLHQIGASGLLLFKDFTTIISKRDDDRNEIAAQLREIYDGKWRRDTGVGGTPGWEGKITVIAAATPALERAWSLKRELGERFVTVRWPRIGGARMARQAAAQRGREPEIARKMKELTFELCCARPLAKPAPLNDLWGERTANLADMVARLRGSVVRESYGKHEIIDVPSIEEPSRLNKTLELLVSSHAALWEREPGADDYRIAKRVAFDSIPSLRKSIFEFLKDGALITQSELCNALDLPESSVRYQCEELAALKVLKANVSLAGQVEYQLASCFQDAVKIALLEEAY